VPGHHVTQAEGIGRAGREVGVVGVHDGKSAVAPVG
jgi:hypothetical protein